MQFNFEESGAKTQLPYQLFFESLPGMYLILNPELEIVAASDQHLKETFTTSRKEVLGKKVDEVFPLLKQNRTVNPNEDLLASFQQVLRSGKAHRMEALAYPLPDPQHPEQLLERYWQVTNSPIVQEGGEVIFLINQVENVTEKVLTQKQLERAREQERTALRKAQLEKERLERFIMEAPAIIVIHSGPDLVFETINPRYQQLFPGRKLLGKPLLEGLPELAGTPIQAMVEHVYQTGETVQGKEVLIPLAPYDGAPLENNYYNFIYQARHNEHGQVDGIMVFAYDVTAQVEARKQVELILDSMPQIVWRANAEGEITYLNQHWYEYTEGKREDIAHPETSNRQLIPYLHPDDGQQLSAQWLRHFPAGEAFEMEVRVKRAADNQYRWHLNRAVPLKNEAGEITFWVGTCTDIDDRKRLEQALAEREARLQAMFEQTVVGIVLTDLDLKLTYANDQYCKILGRSRKEVLSLNMREITHPEDLAG